MPRGPDTVITTLVGEPYALRPDHRDGHSRKSQWQVSKEEEVECFVHARTIGSSSDSEGPVWGLHLADGEPSVLGRSAVCRPPVKELLLAKFVCGNTPCWHGYPADYRRNLHDRPVDSVLRNWRARGYIEKHEISKVRQGKRCSLSS